MLKVLHLVFSHMMDILFWTKSLCILASQQVVFWFGVAVTGWSGWHALRLALSLVAAEGQFWWSLGRQDGIVGRVEDGRTL